MFEDRRELVPAGEHGDSENRRLECGQPRNRRVEQRRLAFQHAQGDVPTQFLRRDRHLIVPMGAHETQERGAGGAAVDRPDIGANLARLDGGDGRRLAFAAGASLGEDHLLPSRRVDARDLDQIVFGLGQQIAGAIQRFRLVGEDPVQTGSPVSLDRDLIGLWAMWIRHLIVASSIRANDGIRAWAATIRQVSFGWYSPMRVVVRLSGAYIHIGFRLTMDT